MKCIRETSADPTHVDCSSCLWNLDNCKVGNEIALERLFEKYFGDIRRSNK